MAWVYKDLGARALAIYLTVIGLFALAAGLIFNAFFSRFVQVSEFGSEHAHGSGTFAVIGAGILALLLIFALWMRYAQPIITHRDAGQCRESAPNANRDAPTRTAHQR